MASWTRPFSQIAMEVPHIFDRTFNLVLVTDTIYDDPEALTGVHAKAASWLETAIDFEIAT